MPSSGNNAHLTDVWGSALAVDSGAVTGERAARIVEWFGAHWAEVVQDGQVRHLPLGQHWAGHVFWEYDVYQNGGYWGTPSGWVLPVIARNSSAVAEQLVRDAISDCRRNGINEWHNNHSPLQQLRWGSGHHAHRAGWPQRAMRARWAGLPGVPSARELGGGSDDLRAQHRLSLAGCAAHSAEWPGSSAAAAAAATSSAATDHSAAGWLQHHGALAVPVAHHTGRVRNKRLLRGWRW
jgi:hypothetical protein